MQQVEQDYVVCVHAHVDADAFWHDMEHDLSLIHI